MPDTAGNIKGIALTGKAGETLDRILSAESVTLCEYCQDKEATEDINGTDACIDCWEKAYGLD